MVQLASSAGYSRQCRGKTAAAVLGLLARKQTALACLVAFSVVGVAPTAAQYAYFGENKVQTRDYQFRTYETEHFRVLFYPGGEGLAEFAGRSAEEYYTQISRDLGVDIEGKTPLIIYLSPGQFSETNVILDVIGEGVGGFSELIKNRIVIPFNGSYNDFHHVIGHELTHIFEFQMYYRSRLASLLGAIDEFSMPLWVLEGFAEFQSGWVNVSSDAFMRDLVINNRLVPLQDLSDGMGYLVYREGESFFRYVEEKYGRKKVYEFMLVLRNRRSLEGAFASVFGVTVKRFSADWEKYLRVKYWPQVVKLDNFERLAKRLTNHEEDGSVYNIAPAISPSGTKIVMISDRLEYADVYVISAFDGRVLKRLVKGGRSGGFESMHLIRPGVAWSPDETSIAVVTTSGGRDNLALIDYATGKVKRRIYGNLDAIFSPRFSPDGRKIVFVGVKNGFSDVYTTEVGGEPTRVTYDIYEERDPVFSPGGDSVAFVSDRPDEGEDWIPGRYAVWIRNGAGEVSRITDRGGQLSHPEFSHSGQYLLYAASDSASNIYAYSLATNRIVRRTNLLGDVSYLTLSRDDRKLAFAYFFDVGWDVAVILDPFENVPSDSGKPYQPPLDTFKFEKAGLDFSRVKPVGFNLSLDYAAGAASYGTSASGGFAGTVNVAFSDMMGDHRFELYTDLYGNILNSDFMFQYWSLPRRVDYGLTFLQLQSIRRYNPEGALVWTLDRGIQTVAAYPFNRFVRIEAGPAGYFSEVYKDTWVYGPSGIDTTLREPTEKVLYGDAALVFDNTYWDWYGPARGTRVRLGVDASFVSDREFRDVFLDFRDYQRLGRRFVFASRLFGISSLGADADQYYLGGIRFLEYAPGQIVVRGYQPAEFYADYGPAAAAFNFELRYPFIDRLKLAFPLPIEFGGVRGVAFLDGGMVAPWRTGRSFHLWDNTRREFEDLKLGVGFGARVTLSYFLLKFDFAKPLSATSDKSWKFILGLGTDF